MGGDGRSRAGVRLMNDYAARWPLWWIEGGQVGDDELPLSGALARDLRSWAQHFEDHFDHRDGWDRAASRAEHARLARELVGRLGDELGGVPVRADLWELEGPPADARA